MVSPRFLKPRPSQPGQGARAGPVLGAAGCPGAVVIGTDARLGGRQGRPIRGEGGSGESWWVEGWAGAGRVGTGDCQVWGGQSRGCPPVPAPHRETCLLGGQVVTGDCQPLCPVASSFVEPGTLSWRPGKGMGMSVSRSVSSVAQSCPTLCNPMNRSMPGLPVHRQLPEFTQTHVHRVGDAIQPSHPLSSPSPVFNLSQHQGLPGKGMGM